MIEDELLSEYHSQFDNLKEVVTESISRSIKDPPDSLFYEHQNVFIKSYLVSACSILEAFVQDLASRYVKRMQERIESANLPFNFVVWVSDHEKAKLEFKQFEVNKGKKEIAELVSPNYWKTLGIFEKLGIDLSKSEVKSFKDFIVTIVEKRNKIVHHNDDAIDLSFNDIVNTIDQFKEYTKCLFGAVSTDPYITKRRGG